MNSNATAATVLPIDATHTYKQRFFKLVGFSWHEFSDGEWSYAFEEGVNLEFEEIAKSKPAANEEFEYVDVDVFFDKYNMVQNHIDDNASFDGAMFETYGAEVEFIRQQPNDRVWTWVDGDGGNYLVQGFCLVNRIGYILVEESFVKGDVDEYIVTQDDDDEDEE